MAAFRFSPRAESDLADIARHTLQTWGEDQTIRYINDIETCCQKLADRPDLGRACEEIRPGLRRMEQGKHVVLYRRTITGVLISRILHERMLPRRQVIDD